VQLALPKDPRDGRTLQERIAQELRQMILDGRLRPGQRLPGSRELAADLGVARITVVVALERLVAEGYLEGRERVGFFVAAAPPDAGLRVPPMEPRPDEGAIREPVFRLDAPPLLPLVRGGRPRPELDFWVGRPDPALFPAQAWREAIRAKLARAGPALAEYPEPQGDVELRAAIAEWLGPSRGMRVDPDDVVVVAGSQEGLNLVARMLVGHVKAFVHEDPCYGGALELFARAGLPCLPVPVDAHGLAVQRLPEIRRALLYVTPSHQYPLGVTLAAERRARLLDWAVRTGSFVLEDDYDGDFRYEDSPLPALAALDQRGCVLYLGTFSKSLAPGLRLGHLVVPPGLRAAARAWKALSSIASPWLEQAAMAEFMRSGAFERHVRRIRRAYRARRDRLIAGLEQLLGPLEISGRRGGMHLAWRLPPGSPPAERIERRALEAGVGIYGLRSAGARASPGHPRLADTLLLGYAALPEPAIDRAVERLGRVLSELLPPTASPAEVLAEGTGHQRPTA
jgi:GntR family transcriptional regulator/MocR family aminotransferase